MNCKLCELHPKEVVIKNLKVLNLIQYQIDANENHNDILLQTSGENSNIGKCQVLARSQNNETLIHGLWDAN